MANQKKKTADKRDATKAADERPVPSQAEGDLKTIEEDLEMKEKAATAGSGKE